MTLPILFLSGLRLGLDKARTVGAVAVPDAPPAVCVVGSDLDGARAGGGADAYPDAPPPFVVAAAAGTGGVGSAWVGIS